MTPEPRYAASDLRNYLRNTVPIFGLQVAALFGLLILFS
jgi:hypothetical protein